MKYFFNIAALLVIAAMAIAKHGSHATTSAHSEGEGGTMTVTQDYSGKTDVSVSKDGEKIIGNGEEKRDERTLGSFTEIDECGAIDVIVQCGQSTNSITLIGDSNILPVIETEVKDGVLRIRSTKNYTTTSKLAAVISCTQVERIACNGTGDFKVNGIKNENMKISLKGTGSMLLQGECASLQAKMNGTGDLHAKELNSKDIRIDIAGTGDALVNADGILNVFISGTGNVFYSGSPTSVKAKVRGTGKCSRI